MSCSEESLQRLRAANPVPTPIEPDWDRLRVHLGVGSRLSPLREDRSRSRGGWAGSRRRSLVCASGLAVLVAAGVLLALAPWSSSPDFLARAAAALTPGPGTILYERWEQIRPAVDAHEFARPGYTAGPDQLWVESGSPHHYRAILQPHSNWFSGPAANRPLAARSLGELVGTYASGPYAGGSSGGDLMGRVMRALGGQAMEIGGTLDSPRRPGHDPERSLVYVPSNEIWSMHFTFAFGADLPGKAGGTIPLIADPLSALRAALDEGRAHGAGTTQLDGRTVIRIDFDRQPLDPPADAPPLPADAPTIEPPYAYVEPETFRPVEIVLGEGGIYRFLAYEYLPATAANLALTSIQAQHPTATFVHETFAHETPAARRPAAGSGEGGSDSESSSTSIGRSSADR